MQLFIFAIETLPIVIKSNSSNDVSVVFSGFNVLVLLIGESFFVESRVSSWITRWGFYNDTSPYMSSWPSNVIRRNTFGDKLGQNPGTNYLISNLRHIFCLEQLYDYPIAVDIGFLLVYHI